MSYADMVTLLLILFVAAAARGLESKPREQPGDLERVRMDLQRRGVEHRADSRGLVIGLPQTILFASGDDAIRAAARPILNQIAEVLRGIPNPVSLIGHADTVPIHNRRFKNNWELSAARGLKLLEMLSAEYGIPESRLSMTSYGSRSPKVPNDTDAGRAENRRVEIVILASQGLPPDPAQARRKAVGP